MLKKYKKSFLFLRFATYYYYLVYLNLTYMKTLKNLVLAASIYALTTACGQTNPSPESKVAVTPPTPVTNKCDNVKNPLEDIDWLKESVQYYKQNGTKVKILEYTYKNKPIYHLRTDSTYPTSSTLRNCDLSINEACGGIGAAGCSSIYESIMSTLINPKIIFEQN
jgi:hypothetical protein